MGVSPRRIALVMAALLAGSLPCAVASPADPPSPPPTAVELWEGYSRAIDGLILPREAFLAALASLERDVSAIVADDVFRTYATAVGSAREKTLSVLFSRKDEQPERSTHTVEEIVSAAEEFERTMVEATDAAITALASAGAGDEESARALKADLYRRILAKAEPIVQAAMRPDGTGGHDALSLWKDAAERDPLIAPAKPWIGSSPLVRDALEQFRAEGERLGRIRFMSVAELSVSYALWGSERIPAALRFDRESKSKRHGEWLKANHAMATAIERALESGSDAPKASGDPLAAAAWSVRYLEAVRTDAVPAASATQIIINTAATLGIAPDEASAMRTISEQSMLARAKLFKQLVATYDEWIDGASKRGEKRYESPPPERLIKAYDALDELDRTTEAKLIAAVQSAFVRKQLTASANAEQPVHLIPWWRSLQTGRSTMPGVHWGPAPAEPTPPHE